MRINKVEKNVTIVEKIKFEKNVHEMIKNYSELYKEVHKEEISTDSLVNEIIKSFLNADREFKKWVAKRTTNNPVVSDE